MTSFVCYICYKSFDNWKLFSNHMHICDNDDEGDGDGIDHNCDVAIAMLLSMTHRMHWIAQWL